MLLQPLKQKFTMNALKNMTARASREPEVALDLLNLNAAECRLRNRVHGYLSNIRAPARECSTTFTGIDN
jgi:hypothetical protein